LFVGPTVFGGVTNEMRIAREEVFGLVVVPIPLRDEYTEVKTAWIDMGNTIADPFNPRA